MEKLLKSQIAPLSKQYLQKVGLTISSQLFYTVSIKAIWKSWKPIFILKNKKHCFDQITRFMYYKKDINNKIALIAYLIANGITIPHYCYHNKLPIAGNCRVCLVELKNSTKPVVSCATIASSVIHKTKMYYDSALIKKARENVLEFLLLNHPLDCPICDQGGDCDLQDQSLFFGVVKRRFYNFKKIVQDKDLGFVVKTVMTRCIHCTRCIRFAIEITGTSNLGVFGRGDLCEIGTYVDKIFASELSGNVIDLCPVGFLRKDFNKWAL